MPAITESVRKLFNKEPNKSINPDEVVAVGAAVQAGILQGDVKDVLLLDVIPLSLGIETLGSVMTRVIEKNTTVPTAKTQIFSTAADNQTSVEIHVLQGERDLAIDNMTLAWFELAGIPAAPRGDARVEVTFDIDANGIVHVNAKDLGTGKEQSIRITASTKLGKDDIEKMVKTAAQFADQDKKRQELAEARNQADTLAYTTEKSLKEYGDKISSEDKSRIEEALKKVREVLKSDNAAEIKRVSDELMQASHKLAEEIYKKAQSSRGVGGKTKEEEPAEKSRGKDDKVVDAEFKVEDEK
jgi:molecular chaperone DnaK